MTRGATRDLPAKITFPALRRFSRLQECELVQQTNAANHTWKIDLLQRTLAKMPADSWLLYLDDDVCVRTNHSLSVWTDQADAMDSSVLAQHMGPRVNNGVFLMKADDRGRSFLHLWRELMPRSPYAFDNGAFNVALLGRPVCLGLRSMSEHDECMNLHMAGRADMCSASDTRRIHRIGESSALVLCPRNPLVPMLQAEDMRAWPSTDGTP